MHPAYSVIFFTVSSGGGYGLLALLGVLGALGMLPASDLFGLTSVGLALVAITFGLLSSTYHLGHPERAWRAFSQWRSSWLSREGVASVITYGPAVIMAAGWLGLVDLGPAWPVIGLIAAVMAAVTVYCTGMIYRSLRTIRQWDNDWTVPNYLILGLATGAVWLHFLFRVFDAPNQNFLIFTVIVLALGLVTKMLYWKFIDENPHEATPESATGLGTIGRVNLFEGPHTEENYLQREMGFRVARTHASKLRNYAQTFGFVFPIIMILAADFTGGGAGIFLALAGAVVASFGMVVERWLFFAEARHVVTLYYGAERV